MHVFALIRGSINKMTDAVHTAPAKFSRKQNVMLAFYGYC